MFMALAFERPSLETSTSKNYTAVTVF